MYYKEYNSSSQCKHLYLILTKYAKKSFLVLTEDIRSSFIRSQVQIQSIHQANLVPWKIKTLTRLKSDLSETIDTNRLFQFEVYLLELINQVSQNIEGEHELHV